MFGLFKKKQAGTDPAQPPPPEQVIEVNSGEDFSDLTTVELCDQAAIDGRIEPFLIIGEQFGGEDAGPNLILGPRGAAAAKARIDEEIVAAIQAGTEVNLEASLQYADGPSRVPQSVRFDLGSLGVRVLKLWG